MQNGANDKMVVRFVVVVVSFSRFQRGLQGVHNVAYSTRSRHQFASDDIIE